MGNRLFVRRRDGRIEVRLNDAGRSVAREVFNQVVSAERDILHEWHVSLNAPIDPSRDEDDPVATLHRQSELATNAELASVTVDEEFLNSTEAWAWLSTLQVALRSTALAHGVLNDEQLAASDQELLEYIGMLQQFLFSLAECL